MSDHGIARDQLRAIVERVERLHEERKAIADDIREIYAEAKGNGYDVATIKEVVKIRGKDRNEWAEKSALLDMYLHALGMIDDTVPSRVHVRVREDTPEQEPQPSLMAGKAAASIPPEVAAEIDTPETAERGAGPEKAPASDGGAVSALKAQGRMENAVGVEPSPSTPFQSDGLHDGRLQAVPAPALDESRDSAAGVEAPAAPVNLDQARIANVLKLRPHCQRPERCRSGIATEHCFTCRQTMASRAGGAA